MLLKSSITKIRIHSDEWYQARLGKLTSSEIHHIMGDKFDTQGCHSYLMRKIGEELTGVAAKDDIDTPATRHGNLYEPEAIAKFLETIDKGIVTTQCLISPINSRFSSTPDAIINLQETQDYYSVESVEVKCPHTFDAYIRLFLCDTPEDVLKEDKKYYWQVIDQMALCDALNGYLVVYQPLFRAGKMKIIPFRKIELFKHFQELEKRKILAEEYFIRVRDKLLAV